MILDDLYCKFTLRPIDPKYFVGRGRQVGRILEVGLINAHLGLINLQGPPKIGRTSLLNFINHLSRNRGKGTAYEPHFAGITDRLCCLYIDMRTLAVNTPEDFKIAFIRSISKELQSFGFGLEDIATTGTGLDFVRVLHAMAVSPNSRYFLFLDRAELLLDKRIQEAAAELMGILNEQIEQFGILLSFGASGILSSHDVFERTRETETCIESISSLMNLFRENVSLGLLNQSDAQDFLRREWYTNDEKKIKGQSFKEDEISWMLDLSGNHPYLLNMVGLLAYETSRQPDSLSEKKRRELENRLLTQLGGFIDSTLRRIPTSAIEMATKIAQDDDSQMGMGEFDEEKVLALEGEGLVIRHNNKIRMPSRLIKRLILARASSVKTILPPSNRPASPHRRLIFKNSNSASAIDIPLTGTESEIMMMLLSFPNKTIPQQQLYSAIWKEQPLEDSQWQQRLIQRVSKLRKKIVNATGDDPIENIYGEGYQIRNPSKYSIK